MNGELSVVIPAYNEETLIERTLSETAEHLDARGYRYELLVIDDGSTDRTAEIVGRCAARRPAIRLIRNPGNRGKGFAVARGVAEARFGLCLFMDADNSTSIREWDRFLPAFEDGAQVVIASRHLPASRIMHPQPPLRRLLGCGYRILCGLCLGIRTSDINCGFKAYRTDLAKDLFKRLTMQDWTFDAEIFCLMRRRGIVHREVPVAWRHEPKASERSWWAPIRTAVTTLRSVARLKRNY